MKKQSTGGLSFMIAIGRWGGFNIEINSIGCRLLVGFISFTITFKCLDAVIAGLINRLKEAEQKLAYKDVL